MADMELAALSPLHGSVTAGEFGDRSRGIGIVLAEPAQRAVVQVSARRLREDALAEAVAAHWGVELPRRPAFASRGDCSFVWSGPGQWMVVAAGGGTALEALLDRHLGAFAWLCDRSDGLACLRMSGPHLREALSRGVPVDLDARAFRPGDAAMTLVEHMAVQLWQVDDGPTFEMVFPRSSAVSLWRWLTASCAPFGYRVLPAA